MPIQTQFPIGLFGKPYGVTWLLYDEFETDEAAPLISPRTMEVGPGQLNYTEASALSIAGGLLNNTAASPQKVLSLRKYQRERGQVFLISTNYTAGGANMYFGVDATGNDVAQAISIHNARTYPWGSFGYWSSQIILACVLTDWGYLYFNCTDGKLTRIMRFAAPRQSFYFRLSTNSDLFNASKIGFGKLRNPRWQRSYPLVTSRVATAEAGQEAVSESNAIIEFHWTPQAGQVLDLEFRCSDAENGWIMRCDQPGGTVRLVERSAGVETQRHSAAQTWTVGTKYILYVYLDGQDIRTGVDSSGKNNYTSSFNREATGVRVSLAGSELCCWPLYVDVFDMMIESKGPTGEPSFVSTAPSAPTAPDDSPVIADWYAAPDGLPENPGTIEAPMDLATALASQTPGQTLMLLDGIYTVDAMWRPGPVGGTVRSYVKAAPGARPIIVHADGYPPFVSARDWTRVEGIWFGGLLADLAHQRAVQHGDYSEYVDCTFFNYFEAIGQGAHVGNVYWGNRFINCGNGSLYHSIYISFFEAEPGEAAIIGRNILVGGQGYHIHLWHEPRHVRIYNNFSGLAQSSLVVNGPGHTVDRNVLWSASSLPLYFAVASGQWLKFGRNVVGKCDVNTWPNRSNQSATDNRFVANNYQFGDRPWGWSPAKVTARLGHSSAAIDAALLALQAAFLQTVEQVHADATIETHFGVIQDVLDAWRDA